MPRCWQAKFGCHLFSLFRHVCIFVVFAKSRGMRRPFLLCARMDEDGVRTALLTPSHSRDGYAFNICFILDQTVKERYLNVQCENDFSVALNEFATILIFYYIWRGTTAAACILLQLAGSCSYRVLQLSSEYCTVHGPSPGQIHTHRATRQYHWSVPPLSTAIIRGC